MESEIGIWKKKDNGLYSMQINGQSDNVNALWILMHMEFAKRDLRYGAPDFTRFENSVINFSMRDLAEAMFLSFTSKDFANYLREFVNEEDTDPHILKTIDVLDDFFRYGFILNESRSQGRWDFWRIYSPDMRSDAITDLIPKKYWSQSKFSTIEDHFSPLLKKGKQIDYFKVFAEKYSGIPKQDEIKIIKMINCGKDTNSVDELRLRMLRQWHHPFILLYDENHNCDLGASLQDKINILKVSYPRLTNKPAEKPIVLVA